METYETPGPTEGPKNPLKGLGARLKLHVILPIIYAVVLIRSLSSLMRRKETCKYKETNGPFVLFDDGSQKNHSLLSFLDAARCRYFEMATKRDFVNGVLLC
jgi:hypothetical protein